MTQRFDKSKLPSRHVSVGVESAPHRSYYYAMGLTEEEIARPFVGIASRRQRQCALQHHARPAG
jgi:dihydroxy-acid dehydratase